MRGYNVDISVKVDELEDNEYSYEREVMFGAEPAEVKYLVQNDAALDQY